VNLGNAGLDIPGYNGGLFADDPLLDTLKVPDAVCEYFRDLGAYDYRPAHEAAADIAAGSAGTLIDVDVLGHIFEQSISDLERLRNELDGITEAVGPEKHKTRRKKEGAFYTPAFITRYIVEQALGGTLRDRFERLRQSHEQEAKGTAQTALADPNVYEPDKLKKPQRDALVRFWESWQDELAGIRLVDPACGSGAFLIEAFDQLHAAYAASNDRLEELRGHRTLFDLDRQILQNNLYGVDLNEEAVEICRLSLWIKTAQRGKVLTSLDHSIRVGNSVVSDPAVHPKALDWQAVFPEVFQAGGFDVVVANPPYIRQEWLAPYKAFWEKSYKSYHGAADLFTYFFELGINVLRESGRLAFITSGSWVRGNFAAPLREFLVKNSALESIVDFGEFQPFEDAEMIRPSITILRKQRPGGRMRIFKWLTRGSPPENLSDVIANAPTMQTEQLSQGAWELDPDVVIDLRKKLASHGQLLRDYTKGRIFRGVLTGLTEVFVISTNLREQLISKEPKSAEIIRPFLQGTHLRTWHHEDSGEFLLAIKSSANFNWPWSGAGEKAEVAFASSYPAVFAYLREHRDQAIKRQDKGRFWWELRACAYWDAFDEPKIIWPDISKLPRFSMDTKGHHLGNTTYTIPGEDYFLLAILSSWSTWFYLSKTAQPLRLRGDRWQYRLFTQFMENLPIPDANQSDRVAIGNLAKRCCAIGESHHDLQAKFQRRLCAAFGQDKEGQPLGKLNTKAQSWWELSPKALGDALKASFKLAVNPLKNPRTADEWEPYLDEKRRDLDVLSRGLADAEAELNERVYRLFNLTVDEIKLLQREVEH
jgi:hypothetical protein